MTEQFDVWAFIETPDGEVHDKVGHNLSAEMARNLFMSYIRPERPGNILGIIGQVLITDKGDMTVAHWKKGEGIVWPKEQ